MEPLIYMHLEFAPLTDNYCIQLKSYVKSLWKVIGYLLFAGSQEV